MNASRSYTIGNTAPARKAGARIRTSHNNRVAKAKKDLVTLEREVKINPTKLIDSAKKKEVFTNSKALARPENEGDYRESLLYMYAKLHRLGIRQENKTKGSNKAGDIYSLLAVYQQKREVLQDLRSIQDLDANAQKIAKSVLHPLFRKVAGEINELTLHVKKILTGIRGIDQRAVEEEMHSYIIISGTNLQEVYHEFKDKLINALVEKR